MVSGQPAVGGWQRRHTVGSRRSARGGGCRRSAVGARQRSAKSKRRWNDHPRCPCTMLCFRRRRTASRMELKTNALRAALKAKLALPSEEATHSRLDNPIAKIAVSDGNKKPDRSPSKDSKRKEHEKRNETMIEHDRLRQGRKDHHNEQTKRRMYEARGRKKGKLSHGQPRK